MDNVSTDSHELLLRRHIRDLLADYFPQHMTTDHVQYLQDITSETLVESLNPIMTCDPTSFALPTDPFDSLRMKLRLDVTAIYDEVWEAQSDVIHYIRGAMGHDMKGNDRLRSERVWDDIDNKDHSAGRGWHVDIMISRSSQNRAPKLGSKMIVTQMSGVGTSLESFLSSKFITKVDEEPFRFLKEEKIEEALDVKLSMDEAMYTSILSLHRITPFMAPTLRTAQNEVCSAHISAFLRNDTPLCEEQLQKMSPTLFPREKRLESGKPVYMDRVKNHEKMVGPIESLDVESFLKQVEVPNIDPDPAEGNMAVVSGWTTLCSSSSPGPRTPSLANDGSEVDELEDDGWMPSSPCNLPERVELLQDAKLDEPLFPRAERLQGSSSRKGPMAASFSSFMLSKMPTNSRVRVVNTESDDSAKFHRQGPSSPPVSISMIGQPPSDPSSEALAESMLAGEAQGQLERGDGFEKDIMRVCKPVNNEKAQDLIMREALDTKESMFIDVPFLEAPNAYLHGKTFRKKFNYSSVPTTVKNLVGEEYGKVTLNKKVAGLKSLNLELSWRPFSYGSTVPTHVDLVGVTTPLHVPLGEQVDVQQLDALLSKVECLTDRADVKLVAPSEVAFLRPFSRMTFDSKFINDDQPLILTRLERVAALCLPGTATQNSERISSSETISDPDRTIHSHPLTPALPYFADNQVQELEVKNLLEWKRRRILPDESIIIARNEDWEDYDSHMNNMSIDPKELVLDNFIPQAHCDVHTTYKQGNTVLSADVFPASAGDIKQIDSQLNRRFSPLIDASTFEPPGQEGVIMEEGPMSYLPSQTNTEHSFNYSKNEPEALANEPDVPLEIRKPTTLSIGTGLPDILTDKSSFSSFLCLRGKKDGFPGFPHTAAFSSPSRKSVQDDSAIEGRAEQLTQEPLDRSTPNDLLDETKALKLPEDWNEPLTQQTYLVSLDLMQKSSLVRILESNLCAVRLVERDQLSSLGIASLSDQTALSLESPVEVSIIPSPHSGIIFFSLAALPSQAQYRTLLASLSAHSFSFSRILLVLEAFPRAHLFRSKLANSADSRDMPYAYSPPVIKAVKRIRRDLALREGLGEKSATCSVDLAFADSVEESAVHARNFGEKSLNDSIVDFASYISEEEQEGEHDLALMQGMNAFSAAVILRCYAIDEFLQMSPEERVAGFAALVGQGRIDLLNLVLNARLEAMSELPASSDYLSSISS